MQRISSNECDQTDRVVISFLESHGGHLRRLAERYQLDYDDVSQEAVLVILQVVHKGGQTFHGYLYKAVLHHLSHLQPTTSAISIDQPLSDDGFTLGDQLAASSDQSQTTDTTASDQRASSLHAALRRLPLDEQCYLRRLYELNAYYPVPGPSAPPDRGDKAISKSAYRHLRNDAILAQEVLV